MEVESSSIPVLVLLLLVLVMPSASGEDDERVLIVCDCCCGCSCRPRSPSCSRKAPLGVDGSSMTPNKSTGIKRSGLSGVNAGGAGETNKSCFAAA